MPNVVKVALYVYGLIFVAELPDKTALAALVLATRHKALPVFVGSAAALAIQSLVAVGAGHLLTRLPPRPVHVVVGLVFIVSAVVIWMRRAEEADDDGTDTPETREGFAAAAGRAFAIVFVAEWGDLTQFATAALAARYSAPIAVFVGATAALWSVAGIAAFLGSRAGRLLSTQATQKVAAVLFGVVGIALVAGEL